MTFGGAFDFGCSIALDETAQVLYVGREKNIYKLSARGGATRSRLCLTPCSSTM